jgi:uncharacterized membrane protein YeaQ/YmgE (transglycosylase-associated protein family)
MLGFIIGLIMIGAVAGFLARLLVPGPDPMSVPMTILLGIGGSFVGGFLINLLFRGNATISPAGWIGSIVGAVIVLLIYRATVRRGRTGV